MKATLKFNLPEEDREFRTAVNALSYYRVIWELLASLRDKLKYSELSSEEQKVYEEIRTLIYTLVEDNNLSSDF